MGMASVLGFALVGINAVPVRVEAHVRPGIPGMTVVGLPDAAVREAKERVRSAALASGCPLPAQRTTVSLSPGDLRKEGSGFDLAVALAVLAAAGFLPEACLRGVAAVGELALDGSVRGVRGVISMAETSRRMGVRRLLIPTGLGAEAAEVLPNAACEVSTLRHALDICLGKVQGGVAPPGGREGGSVSRMAGAVRGDLDLADIAGQHQAKRALEVAAAGAHHLLMVGSPGSGKTMLARRLPGLLTPLDRQEALDVTRIWSAAGLRSESEGLAMERPFRAPHHTISRSALIGGGSPPRPGEVTLAHRGVLFLDEAPEFSRDALEALRQPLEEGRVIVGRKALTLEFPSRFVLVGAMNPCPCGFWGHPTRACRCSAGVVRRYQDQLSGPLLDRIDLVVEMPPLSLLALTGREAGESSAIVQRRVVAARAFRAVREQAQRHEPAGWEGGAGGSRPEHHPAVLERRYQLSREAVELLHAFAGSNLPGGRTYTRVLSVSRTIADLDQSDSVRCEHLAEALALRVDGRAMWAA